MEISSAMELHRHGNVFYSITVRVYSPDETNTEDFTLTVDEARTVLAYEVYQSTIK